MVLHLTLPLALALSEARDVHYCQLRRPRAIGASQPAPPPPPAFNPLASESVFAAPSITWRQKWSREGTAEGQTAARRITIAALVCELQRLAPRARGLALWTIARAAVQCTS